MNKRLSATAYAAKEGLHPKTVQKWCRNALKGFPNKRLPYMAVRKRGRDMLINVEC